MANEQIDEQGRSWRSGAVAEKKTLSQWFVRTTDLAEILLKDLEKLKEWPDVVKEMQKGWIGLKQGFEITFKLINKKKNIIGNIDIFTTKIETIYGVTFLGVMLDYDGLEGILCENDLKRIREYSERNKTKEDKLKDGLLLESIMAVHPLTGVEVPIYICNYIIKDFGTGAIMGVPSHDERDQEFAEKFKIDMIKVLNENGNNNYK